MRMSKKQEARSKKLSHCLLTDAQIDWNKRTHSQLEPGVIECMQMKTSKA